MATYSGPYGGAWSAEEGYKPEGLDLPEIGKLLWDAVVNPADTMSGAMPYAVPGSVPRSPFSVDYKIPTTEEMYRPATTDEEAQTTMARLWGDFMGAGGQKAEFRNADGSITKMVKKEPTVPKQPGQQPQRQPGQPTQSPPPPQQTWGNVAAPPVVAQPTLEEEKARMERENDQQAKLASRVYTPANAPYTAVQYQEEANRIAAEAARLKGEAREKAYPSRAELMKQGYANVSARMSKGQRVMMSILNQDIFYTDKLAAGEAEYERVMRENRGKGKVDDINVEYTARIASLDKRIGMEKEERAAIAEDIERTMFTSPNLMKNRDKAKDYVIAKLHISEERADKYVDDHFNPVTQTYEVRQSPYKENIKIAVEGANIVQTILPNCPRELAMAIGFKHPEKVVELADDELKLLDARIGHHKGSPQELQELQNRRKEVSVVREGYAKNETYLALTELKSIREGRGWDQLSQQNKDDWGNKVRAVYTVLQGVPPHLDPERLWLDLKLQKAQIDRLADEHLAFLQKQDEDKKALPPKDKLIKAAFVDTQFITGKNKDYDMAQRMKLDTLEDLARDTKLDKEWTNEKSKVITPEDRRAMQNYKEATMNELAADYPEARTALGSLTNREAVSIMDSMEKATASGRKWLGKHQVAVILADRKREEERLAKLGKKR